jgi:hypothetical protein
MPKVVYLAKRARVTGVVERGRLKCEVPGCVQDPIVKEEIDGHAP